MSEAERPNPDEILAQMKREETESARGKLKRLSKNYGWTEFVKLRKDEIARLIKESDTDVGSSESPSGDSEPMPEAPALPAMAAALLPSRPGLTPTHASTARTVDAATRPLEDAVGERARSERPAVLAARAAGPEHLVECAAHVIRQDTA